MVYFLRIRVAIRFTDFRIFTPPTERIARILNKRGTKFWSIVVEVLHCSNVTGGKHHKAFRNLEYATAMNLKRLIEYCYILCLYCNCLVTRLACNSVCKLNSIVGKLIVGAGVGFAVGFERALLALQAFGSDLGADEAPCVYVANAGKELRQNVFAITQKLRAAGIVTEADYQGRSLKAQFKQADKVGAKLILVLGGDELAAGKVKVRDMQSHDEVLVDLSNVVESVRERL